MILTNAIVTAWCACSLCCGPLAPRPTASGLWPRAGRTVAGPRSVPLGTPVIIAGRRYVVEDRTARRYDGRFDIYFDTHKEALRFGKQRHNVTIGTKQAK